MCHDAERGIMGKCRMQRHRDVLRHSPPVNKLCIVNLCGAMCQANADWMGDRYVSYLKQKLFNEKWNSDQYCLFKVILFRICLKCKMTSNNVSKIFPHHIQNFPSFIDELMLWNCFLKVYSIKNLQNSKKTASSRWKMLCENLSLNILTLLVYQTGVIHKKNSPTLNSEYKWTKVSFPHMFMFASRTVTWAHYCIIDLFTENCNHIILST